MEAEKDQGNLKSRHSRGTAEQRHCNAWESKTKLRGTMVLQGLKDDQGGR